VDEILSGIDNIDDAIILIGVNLGVIKGSDIPGSPNAPIDGLSCRKMLKTLLQLHQK